MLRCKSEGYVCSSMQDPAGRRGIWFRTEPVPAAEIPMVKVLEICAGREGDDEYVKLELGGRITSDILMRLTEILDMGRWNLELAQEAAQDAGLPVPGINVYASSSRGARTMRRLIKSERKRKSLLKRK